MRFIGLTHQQKNILQDLKEGLGIKEIAVKRKISLSTVYSHISYAERKGFFVTASYDEDNNKKYHVEDRKEDLIVKRLEGEISLLRVNLYLARRKIKELER